MMDLLFCFIETTKNILDLLCSIHIIFFAILIIIIYHIILSLIRDKRYIKAFRSFEDPDVISLDDLNEKPLVNIIIPAWNEGESFAKCLEAILGLNYPRIKVIINAGGSKETINIVDRYKSNKNFIILTQEKGPYIIQGKNKLRALNQCFKYVSEGILYLIDADCYINDEILLRMIFPIINYKENVVSGSARPLKSLENKDLTKFLLINKFDYFKNKISRYTKYAVSGTNTCLSYEVIKSIGSFNEKGVIIEEISRANDIVSKGFNLYNVVDYRSRIFTHFPITLKELYSQRKRYLRYILLYSFQMKRRIQVIKIFFLLLISIYILILPIFLFIHLGLFIIGILILFSLYIQRIRKYIFFKRIIDKTYYTKFHFTFFIKMIFYIYFELISTFKIFFGFIPFFLKFKKNKVN